jgi:hypothetical protein
MLGVVDGFAGKAGLHFAEQIDHFDTGLGGFRAALMVVPRQRSSACSSLLTSSTS